VSSLCDDPTDMVYCPVGTDLRQRWPATDLNGSFCPDPCQDGGRVRGSPNTGTFEVDQPLNYRAGPGRSGDTVQGGPHGRYSQADAQVPRASGSGPRQNQRQGVAYDPAGMLADHMDRDFGRDSYGGVGGEPALVYSSGSVRVQPIGEYLLQAIP